MLQDSYKSKKKDIKKRLLEFKEILNKSEEKVYAELVFCLLTPQSKAKVCDVAVKKLTEKGKLLSNDSSEIKAWLAGVRFNNQKSKRVAEARNLFSNGSSVKLKDKLEGDPKEIREWLVENVKGLGYKESGHFLRNVGLGENLAILDRHILKNLLKYNVIDEIPNTLTPKKYFEIEEKMKKFSKEINIPMGHLDLLFWSEEAGEIFK